MDDYCLLNLVVTPEVEDAVSDWLLEYPAVAGFSTYPISGHGSSEHAMSLAEQVAGRRRQLLFQLYLPCAKCRVLLSDLRNKFHGSGMHYWLTPVLEAGHLD